MITCWTCGSSACSILRASNVASRLSRRALKVDTLLSGVERDKAWHALPSFSSGSVVLLNGVRYTSDSQRQPTSLSVVALRAALQRISAEVVSKEPPRSLHL